VKDNKLTCSYGLKIPVEEKVYEVLQRSI
jgi:hypothetical protein